MTVCDVVFKLTGSIIPVGDSHEDARRLDNLKVVCELVNTLVADIDQVASATGDHMASIKEAKNYAEEFLTNTLGIKE